MMKRTLRYLFTAGAVLFITPALVLGQRGSGAEFLKINYGIVSSGMGGAGGGIYLGPETAYLNPAGLGFNSGNHEISFSHVMMWQEIKMETVSSVFSMGKLGAAGFSLLYMYMPPLEATDSFGRLTGDSYKIYDLMGSLTYAYRLHPAISAGVTGKWVNRRLGRHTAEAWAADAGVVTLIPVVRKEILKPRRKSVRGVELPPVRHIIRRDISLGISILNIGQDIRFRSENEPLPMMLKGGAGYMPFKNVTIAADADWLIRESRFNWHSGIEWRVIDALTLRAGYEETDDLGELSGICAGLSLTKPEKEDNYSDYISGSSQYSVRVDYAFGYKDVFGSVHRVSLRFLF